MFSKNHHQLGISTLLNLKDLQYDLFLGLFSLIFYTGSMLINFRLPTFYFPNDDLSSSVNYLTTLEYVPFCEFSSVRSTLHSLQVFGYFFLIWVNLFPILEKLQFLLKIPSYIGYRRKHNPSPINPRVNKFWKAILSLFMHISVISFGSMSGCKGMDLLVRRLIALMCFCLPYRVSQKFQMILSCFCQSMRMLLILPRTCINPLFYSKVKQSITSRHIFTIMESENCYPFYSFY